MSITLPFKARHADNHVDDYRPPKPDTSRVKIKITRACWVRLHDGEPLTTAQPGAVLTLPRWEAQQIVDTGRGELV